MRTLGIFLTINIWLLQYFLRFVDKSQEIQLDNLFTKVYNRHEGIISTNVILYYLKFHFFEVS